ncbi:unnamed protein product [Allacma fusca]|uniref:Lipase 3-like n=1 Tax=Allacma fusca TaxID=39272 RepID=A0A8J2NQS6_9HEXA|nr:unnamed protein product [Allacma fusca]
MKIITRENFSDICRPVFSTTVYTTMTWLLKAWAVIFLLEWTLVSGLVRNSGQYLQNTLVLDPDTLITDEVGEKEFRHEVNPDVNLTALELIEKYGYPAESHTVTTKDGYILTLHRIPHGKNASSGPRPVAFVQHGFFSSSVDWLFNRVDKAIPYMLADRGYDVWLGNARGNTYSRRHVKLSPEKSKFWQFSYDEMGLYDLPAVIDYVLNTTKQPDMYYIGHSMGAGMFFVCMSSYPEYNHKIRFMAAMGPAVYLNNMRGPARYLAPLASLEKVILDLLGHGEILPEYIVKYINTYAPEFCTPEMKLQELCENFVFLLAGFDPAQTNTTELPVILAHTPTTSSTKTLIHFLQAISSGKFRKYDFGSFRNKFIYGQWTPPKYDLSKVKVPVALYHAPNDMLVDTKDVARLAKDLPNLVGSYEVNLTQFNHIDFIYAIDVDVLVNKPLLELMTKY